MGTGFHNQTESFSHPDSFFDRDLTRSTMEFHWPTSSRIPGRGDLGRQVPSTPPGR